MSVIEPCPTPGCDGEVAVGLFSEIRVTALNEDGTPMLDPKGSPVKVLLRLPKHVLPLPLRGPTPLRPLPTEPFVPVDVTDES